MDDELNIMDVLDKMDKLEDDVKLCYEEIKGLETEIETLKKKGNTAMEIIDYQGEQIGQLIDIIEIYSKCFDNISDVVEQLSKNKYKCTESRDDIPNDISINASNPRIQKILEGTLDFRAKNLGELNTMTLGFPSNNGSQLTVAKRRIPFYEEEHPKTLTSPKRATKSTIDTSKIGKEYVGTVVVTLRQTFRTIEGNIILGVEFDKIDDNMPHIHDGDYIEIHSAYVDDSIYFGKILTLKRFKDSFPVIPINSFSKEYGIQIKVDDDKVDFSKYVISKIAIDLYR